MKKTPAYDSLQKLFQKRIVLLDGAMGTMIQKQKLTENDFRAELFAHWKQPIKGNNDILSLTAPNLISNIHRQFLEVGCDIIETNTFNSTNIAQSDYKMEEYVHLMNYQSAKLAKSIADEFTTLTPNQPRYVAGAIGPTNKTASISNDVTRGSLRSITFDELVLSYTEQIEALALGGVDLFLIETIFDTLNAKACIFALKQYERKMQLQYPVIISGTITDASGRTLSGQTPSAFYISIAHANPLAVSFNCALGAKDLYPHLKELHSLVPCFIGVYPNAGLPNAFGEYDETPEMMAKILGGFAVDGLLNLVGGCCGTTPEHIKKIKESCIKYPPRKKAKETKVSTYLSGLQELVINEDSLFINVGERANVTGSKKFYEVIKNENWDSALEICKEQIKNGAQIIDINLDEAMLDTKKLMQEFINLIQSEPEIATIPLMIDSSNWDCIVEGLKRSQGKCIVNSIALKDGEEEFLKKAQLAYDLGACVVVMAFDETGQADTLKRKVEICKRAYLLLIEKVSFPPQDIIFDPNIFAIATGINEHRRYGLDFLEAIKEIKNCCPHALISGGVSNISFAFRGNEKIRQMIHTVFLYHATKVKMTMGIVPAGQLGIYEQIPLNIREKIENVLFDKSENAQEELLQMAIEVKSQQGGFVNNKQSNELEWRKKNLEERFVYSLVNGIDAFIEEDLKCALEEYPRVLSIIEGPLMKGMNQVGDLFGQGKMFLPQVVKSARVMKKASTFLFPYMKNSNEQTKYCGKILLATVKGDVHDIGKNIVGVVLSCNNFEIIDLGVMVPNEKILEVALKENVDIIGVSGLITPSLEMMCDLAKEFSKNNIKTPLLIGGATTSRIHTAVKVAPLSESVIIHVADASKAVPVANRLLNWDSMMALQEEVNLEYEELRRFFYQRIEDKKFLSLDKAREQRLQITENIKAPKKLGIQFYSKIDLKEVVSLIDWTPFFHTWELKGSYPQIFESAKYGESSKKLFEDAQKILDDIIHLNLLDGKALVGIFQANSDGDDINIYDNDIKICTLNCLRQQQEKENNSPYLCLSDFLAPIQNHKRDYIGMFVVSSGLKLDSMLKKYTKEWDDYNIIMAKALADRFAEALAEYMHLLVRREIWGYEEHSKFKLEDLLKEKFNGIRPAPGYPACPDHTEKLKIFSLLKVHEYMDVTLTESMAMDPASSVCGLYFSHPESRYFNLGKIDKDQLEDYALRKNMSVEEMEKWLRPNLI